MGELSKHVNIGKVLEQELESAGIHTIEELKETGSCQAWLMIKPINPSACLNKLCALEGAVRGVRWHNLPQEVKAELKEFFDSFQ